MIVEVIRRSLAAYQPARVDDERVPRAAVALVLRTSGDDLELLLIRRAERAADPWSGQMGLPGGHRERSDRDLIQTAVRETHEEVSLDLGESGELIGALDDLGAVARDGPVDLVISPFVFVVPGLAELRPDPREVRQVVWVPLSFLRSTLARTVYRRAVHGVEIDFPAYAYEGHIIWGLTHRILEQFLAVTVS